jgi:putative membrane protein
MTRSPGASRLPAALLLFVAVALVASGIRPYDRLTWLLEVLPVLIAAPLLIATRRSFPLTPLVYWLIAIHSLILILGGHYTYARVPLGFWIQDWFDFTRNHYDRIGHLMQGLGPAIVIRELLIRTSPLAPGKWLFTIILFTVLGVSATYEFIEWGTALASEEASEAFLGTQGDVWDTQWDMFLAGCGAIVAQFVFERLHDRQLAVVDPAVRPKVVPRA